MADLTVVWQALLGGAGGGGIILGIGRFIAGLTKRGDDAKDETIALLREQKAVADAEVVRLRKELAVSRSETEQARRVLESERDRTVGVAARMRMDSQVDEREFEEDLPTKVRQRVELVAPKGSIRPAGIPDKRRLAPGAGHADYDAVDVDNITPTALAPTMSGKHSGRRG